MDVRLKSYPFKFDGAEYTLRCNMNVLAEAQELNGGNFDGLLDKKKSTRSVLLFLAAMLNDDLEERGNKLRFTPREIGQKLTQKEFRDAMQKVMELVIASVALPEDERTEEESEKKQKATGAGETESTSRGT